MPQSERTVTMFFDAEEWDALERRALARGFSPGDAAYEILCTHLFIPQKIEDALEPPPGEWTVPGEVADEYGAIAVRYVADRLGRRIRAEGGKRHNGRVFGAGKE